MKRKLNETLKPMMNDNKWGEGLRFCCAEKNSIPFFGFESTRSYNGV